MNSLWAALIGAVVGGVVATGGGLLGRTWEDLREARAAARAIRAELDSHAWRWRKYLQRLADDAEARPGWADELKPGMTTAGWVRSRPLLLLAREGRDPPLGLSQTSWEALRVPVLRVADEEDLDALLHWYEGVNSDALADLVSVNGWDVEGVLDGARQAASHLTTRTLPRLAWGGMKRWPSRLGRG